MNLGWRLGLCARMVGIPIVFSTIVAALTLLPLWLEVRGLEEQITSGEARIAHAARAMTNLTEFEESAKWPLLELVALEASYIPLRETESDRYQYLANLAKGIVNIESCLQSPVEPYSLRARSSAGSDHENGEGSDPDVDTDDGADLEEDEDDEDESDTNRTGQYQASSIQLTVTGGTGGILSFLRRVGTGTRLLLIEDLILARSESGLIRMQLELTAPLPRDASKDWRGR